MTAQKGHQPEQVWPSKTISFVGDIEMECWLDELAERLYGPRGRSELMRRIINKYRAAVERKRPGLATSSIKKQAILDEKGAS